MPYQGKSVSIFEMLEVLTSNGRTEVQAGIELERAFEENAVRLFAPPSSDAGPWRELSIDETKGVISLLRDLCNRAPTKTIATWNLPIDLFKAVRAIRSQFERECELVSAQPAPVEATAPMERKDAVRACIESGMIPASTATWDVFCGKVRDLADGWKDKKNGTLKRGFDERTIKRDVNEIMN
jgi:hypothetical protein